MLGSISGDDGFAYRTPHAMDGINTGGAYTTLPHVNEPYARAKDAGARIVRELGDTNDGSREFSACDPEDFS